MLELVGYNVTFVLDGESLKVRHKKSETTIPLASVASCELKPPRGFTRGTLTVKTNESKAAFMGVGSFVLGFGGEHTLVFDENDLAAAREFADKISNYSSKKGESSFSSADEIVKYKKLLDNGVITQEEFDAQKHKLLGV